MIFLIYYSHSGILSSSCCSSLNIPSKLYEIISTCDYLKDCRTCILVPVSTSEDTNERTRIVDADATIFEVLSGREGCVLKLEGEILPNLLRFCDNVRGKETGILKGNVLSDVFDIYVHIPFSDPKYESYSLHKKHRILQGQKEQGRFISNEDWRSNSFIVGQELHISLDMWYSHVCYLFSPCLPCRYYSKFLKDTYEQFRRKIAGRLSCFDLSVWT